MWGCRAGHRRQRHGKQGQPSPSRGGWRFCCFARRRTAKTLCCGSSSCGVQVSVLGSIGVTSARHRSTAHFGWSCENTLPKRFFIVATRGGGGGERSESPKSREALQRAAYCPDAALRFFSHQAHCLQKIDMPGWRREQFFKPQTQMT